MADNKGETVSAKHWERFVRDDGTVSYAFRPSLWVRFASVFQAVGNDGLTSSQRKMLARDWRRRPRGGRR